MKLVEGETSIYVAMEPCKDGEDYYEPGYYFADEAQLLNGPFNSYEECKRALTIYVENL